MRYPPYMEEDILFPKFFRVRMNYPWNPLENIEAAVRQTLDRILPKSGIVSGNRVAIGIGSRGIANLPAIVKAVCVRLKDMGAMPFIIPAMGSHGNATADGQKKILATLAITESACGAPVCSSLAVRQLGTVFKEVPVFFSQDALEADHCICVNRIKPHTKFKASVESGIFKMLCVGMGKHEGALAFHRWALKYGFFSVLEAIGKAILAKSNFRFGIGIVEDAHKQPLGIEAVLAENLWEREKELLKIARKNIPRLPIRNADVLVIRQIGKDISGAGMDPNVTGRAYDLKEDDFSEIFQATRVAILNLSKKTGGNAVGVGNADIITEKVYQQMDYETTVMNAMTGMSLRKAFIPVRFPTDYKAIQACFTTIGPVPPEAVRAVIIQDTLRVVEFWTSEAFRADMEAIPDAEILETIALRFDDGGNLLLPERTS